MEEDFKYKIVRKNLHLPADRIKKELKVYFPEVTNEEVIKLIIEVTTNKRANMKKKTNTKKYVKPREKEENER